MATISETIEQAAAKFGVTREQILAGKRCRNAWAICAREWVISQHPSASGSELARALGLSNHTVVAAARKRLPVCIVNMFDRKSKA